MTLPRWLRPSLRLRVGFGGFVLLLGGLGALVGYIAVSQHRLIEASAKADYLDYTRGVAILVAEHVARGDRERIDELVAMTADAGGENIRYIAVEDVWGRPYVSTGRPAPLTRPILEERVIDVVRPRLPIFSGEDQVFELGVPILRDGVRYGSVRMGISTRLMNENAAALVRTVAVLIGLGIVMATVLAFLVDRRLRKLLSRFIHATRRMTEGDLERQVEIHTGDDLEELARNFNRMAAAVRERDAALRRAKETLEETVRERTRELSAEKERLGAIVGAVGAGMLLLDPELRIVWMNGIAESWLGAGRELLGQVCPWVSGSPGTHCAECPSALAATSAQTAVADAIPLRIDGVQRYFTVISSPICDASDRVTEVLELLLDVTRQKQVEADLVQAAKLASVGELAGGVAHEIGNPVTIISAKAKLLLADLRAGRAPRRLERDIEKIEHHAERIAHIAEKLLTFARRSPGERSSVRFDEVVGEALGLLEHRLAAGQVRLVSNVADDLPELRGSRNELVQVVVNLLQNAIDAMPRGGEIRIDAGERDGSLHVLVSDTGTGMTTAVMDRLFQPFFTTKEPGRGTGLGLSISQSIVRDHGGNITVETRPGEGTTFAFRIPVAAAELHA